MPFTTHSELSTPTFICPLSTSQSICLSFIWLSQSYTSPISPLVYPGHPPSLAPSPVPHSWSHRCRPPPHTLLTSTFTMSSAVSTVCSSPPFCRNKLRNCYDLLRPCYVIDLPSVSCRLASARPFCFTQPSLCAVLPSSVPSECIKIYATTSREASS